MEVEAEIERAHDEIISEKEIKKGEDQTLANLLQTSGKKKKGTNAKQWKAIRFSPYQTQATTLPVGNISQTPTQNVDTFTELAVVSRPNLPPTMIWGCCIGIAEELPDPLQCIV